MTRGRVIGAFGVLQDISERKNAEADLRRAHQSLANAQRIAHVGNWSRHMDDRRGLLLGRGLPHLRPPARQLCPFL